MSRLMTLWRLSLWGYALLHLWFSWTAVISLLVGLLLFVAVDLVAIFFVSVTKKHPAPSQKIWKILSFCVFTLPLLAYFIAFLWDQFLLKIPTAQIHTHLNLDPLWLPLCLFYALSLCAHRFKKILPYEIILRMLILISAFVYAKDYEILFYPHPGLLFFSLLTYLILEAFYLLALHIKTHKTSKSVIPKALFASTLFILPLGIMCFILYQFISTDLTKHSGGLLQPTLNSFDFNQSLSLENEIQLGKNLLLFVHLDKEFSGRLLFKRREMAGYSEEKGFFVLDKLQSHMNKAPEFPILIPHKKFLGREAVTQDFYLVNLEKNAFFSLDYPIKSHPILDLENKDNRFRSAYQVVSETIMDRNKLEEFPQIEHVKHEGISSDEKHSYLYTGDIKEIMYLAKDIIGEETSAYRQAQIIESYLKLNYLYSLKPGGYTSSKNTKEAINQFLFESRKGYCTYFAFAMALMTRGLGMPTRVVSGFFIDAKDKFMGYYPVKAQQAHAWVEIYFDGFGWITFDPTSDQIDGDSIDSVNYGYEPDNLYPFIEELLNSKSLTSANTPSALTYQKMRPQEYNKPQAFLLALCILLLLCVLYTLFILYSQSMLGLTKMDDKHKVCFYMKRFLFKHKLLTKTMLLPLEFLVAYPHALALYRQALFAKDFTHTDLHHFLLHLHEIKMLHKVSLAQEIMIFFHPAWISFRMHYNHEN